jgi:hypothetical protein
VGLRLGSRVSLLIVVSSVLCLLALLIGTSIFYWRLRRLDEALRPTAAKLESLQAEANAAQSKAGQVDFLMADPNGRWEATDVIRDPELPRRRLASVAMSAELCLLFYEHGGIGKNDNVAAFRISDNHAEPIWHAYVPHEVANPTELTKALQEKHYREAPFF